MSDIFACLTSLYDDVGADDDDADDKPCTKVCYIRVIIMTEQVKSRLMLWTRTLNLHSSSDITAPSYVTRTR